VSDNENQQHGISSQHTSLRLFTKKVSAKHAGFMASVRRSN